MTIGNAIAFIRRGINDSELRERLTTAPSINVRDEALSDEGLQFSQHEFEEAFRNLLVLCQEAEAADQLNEFKIWWEFLTHSFESGARLDACSGC